MTTALADPRQTRLVEWLKTLNAVISDVSNWAQSAGWLVHQSQRAIQDDEDLGTYNAPMLQIKTPVDHLFVEPVGKSVMGADGRIDIYAWPSLHRVMLLLENGRWLVRDEQGGEWPTPWSREMFVEMADQLTRTK